MGAADEPDGVDETFDGMLRVGLTAAGQMAEVYARHREQQARDARAASEQEARELGARLHAERAAARAQLAPVQRSEWWDQAQPDQITQAWKTAQEWEHHDPDAARAVDRIRREVQDRHGIDVDAPGGGPASVQDTVKRRGIHDELLGAQHATAARDETEAARLLMEAARAEQSAERADALEAAGSDSYDTADRRRDLATSLEGVTDVETTQARIVADTFQARSPGDAVTPGRQGRVPAQRAPTVGPPVKQRIGTIGR